MLITRTADSDTTTWALAVDGEEVAWLSVWTVNREVCNTEVRRAHQGRGYARLLFEHADADFGGIFHTIPQHRTDEGSAFAAAVGGDTIDEVDALVIDGCCCDHCDA